MSDLTLAEFLAARLDEDEAAAKLVESTWPGHTIANVLADPLHYAWQQHDVSPTRAAHIARHDPARVLRQVEAGRKILAEVVPQIEDMDQQIISEWRNSQTVPDAHLPLLKIMAAVYSDHPDYREEWKP